MSVDPLTSEYPELTPYQFAGNTPIWASDLDGLEPWFAPWLNSLFRTSARLAKATAESTKELVKPIRWGSITPRPVRQYGSRGGPGAGKNFPRGTKNESWSEELQKSGGQNKCKDCGKDINRYGKNEKGKTPPEDQAQADHQAPKTPRDGLVPGNNSKENLTWKCRGCNNDKSNYSPEEYYQTPPIQGDNTATSPTSIPLDYDKKYEIELEEWKESVKEVIMEKFENDTKVVPTI